MVADAPILAVSSPPGRSARGLIRLSGDRLGPLLAERFDPPLPPRRLTRTRWSLAHAAAAAPMRLPCLACFFPAGHSFTGQDVLELQVPGHPALLERILADLRDCIPGARLAEPGEFTQRAFLHGRIDLTQAEGIAATISAVGDAQLQAAALLRRGRLGQWSATRVSALADMLALVEAGIDFTDEQDVVPMGPKDLDDRLAGLLEQVEQMLSHSRPWETLDALPWVVLAGAPNVGKSTLFNVLLGQTRAVTSAMAGTTRDVLAEPLTLHQVDRETGAMRRVEVMLVDLAGLDRGEDAMGRAMQHAAAEALRRAELVLLLNDGSAPWPKLLTPAPQVRLRTKCELPSSTPTSVGADRCDREADLAVSAHSGAGLNELRTMIAERLKRQAVRLAGQMLALRPRHIAALESAQAELQAARDRLAGQRSNRDLADAELVAAHLRAALDGLGELGGRMSPDEVIGRVFATFCVGK